MCFLESLEEAGEGFIPWMERINEVYPCMSVWCGDAAHSLVSALTHAFPVLEGEP